MASSSAPISPEVDGTEPDTEVSGVPLTAATTLYLVQAHQQPCQQAILPILQQAPKAEHPAQLPHVDMLIVNAATSSSCLPPLSDPCI